MSCAKDENGEKKTQMPHDDIFEKLCRLVLREHDPFAITWRTANVLDALRGKIQHPLNKQTNKPTFNTPNRR
jgi:hypothetical protein